MQDHFDEFERTNTILSNQIQLFTAFFLLIFVIMDAVELNTDVFISIGILLPMLGYFLIRNNISYIFAVSMQLTVSTLAISLEYYIHNLELRVEPLYIVSAVLGILLLPKPYQKVLFLGSMLSCYLSVIIAVQEWDVLIRNSTSSHDNFSLFIFAFFMIGIIIFRYITLIKQIMKNKTKLVNSLQIKNNELERFAYITSHDLKQPLRNIGSFAGLLKRFIDKPDRVEKNLEYLGEIENSASRMHSLIEEILSFSKISNTEITKEIVDLDVVINEFERSHSEMLKERGAIINYTDLPIVSGNKLYLSLLFQNLVENGIKYNTSEIPIVNITSTLVGDQYEIKITDNGIGISDEFKAAIFEPFKRLHSKKTYEGTGLGLSICMKIVETHNGKLWLDNTEEAGST